MITENILSYHNKNFSGGNNKKFSITKLYNYITKKNMKCLLIPLDNATTITVSFMIPSGSRQETEAFGIAHFLEHMTFKGTKEKTSEEIMLKLDSIGAQYNAMTSYEYTIYYISGDPNDINIILDILIDLYLNPIYPESDIKNERNVVLEELRMTEDKNHRVISDKISYNLYKNIDDGLARPIIGYKETIEKLNREDIIKYRDKHYNISKCLLCISGNFIKKDIKNIIKNKFKTKLKRNKFNFEYNYDLNFKYILDYNNNIDRHINIYKDINQSIIYFYFNIIDKNNSNILAIDLICDILSNGFSSRLFNLLRNKMGVSYYNSSFTRVFKKHGNMIINVGVDNNSVIYTIEEILKELNNMRLNGITIEELNKSKKQNQTNLLFQFKNPYEYLMHYGMCILDELPLESISKMIINIQNITLENINNIIKMIFNNKNLIIGTIGKITDEQSLKIKKLIENSFL